MMVAYRSGCTVIPDSISCRRRLGAVIGLLLSLTLLSSCGGPKESVISIPWEEWSIMTTRDNMISLQLAMQVAGSTDDPDAQARILVQFLGDHREGLDYFFVRNGTPVRILETRDLLFHDVDCCSVQVLSGRYRDRTGWIHGSLLEAD